MSEQQGTGAAGIQITRISQEEHAQFGDVVDKLDRYSKNLVASFDQIVKQIHDQLLSSGSVSLQALQTLLQSHNELMDSGNQSFQVLEQITKTCEDVISQFSGLDAIQNETMLLSDLLTAIEETVKTTAVEA